MEILHSRKMNFKGRSAGRRSLRVPPTFFLCFFFFICGLFASKLLSRQEVSTGLHPKLKVQEENREFHPLSHGETGEDSLTHIPFQVLSWKPRALYFPGFATPEQCESIIKIAKASLEPSTLALRKGEKAENLKGIRTSSGTFIKASEDKSGTLDIIEDKISSATMIPRTHGEAFNILRYEIGQKYRPHYDAFNPNIYGQVKSQRVASFLLYLSDVEEGGETMFPYENGLNYDNYDPDACAGLKVKPRKGDGLLFYSLYPNGTIDKASLHGSCPVIRGQKWVATKWLRNQLWVPKGG
ncbi:probable prolyl 4-hydroxylase 9 isoform X1 [Daucus carota subsp. sativus]|uniref:probable prolyl 4-hydroxylase 9 isoform X1 n=1 Tax=Daucus carota subsp. sativus TaxID=79200 RepID=UPI0007EF6026|nr:PREDICTED: probable prolyl 4-hydroxylase 9 isoform X1 [Daucus carota subsp. sativus]XP_017238449.1 PREDICTED: probable prolyl 4-hydroxylase 9 isoform X1 [Daucus carota subsp. sativus]